MLDGTDIVTLIGGACIITMVAAGIHAHLRIARTDMRTVELRLSADLLRTHQDRLEAFFNNERAPDAKRYSLLKIAELFDDRTAMRALVEILEDQPEAILPPGGRAHDSLADLDADLRELFVECVITGLLGTALRWPETARCYSLLNQLSIKNRIGLMSKTTEAYGSLPRASAGGRMPSGVFQPA